MVYLGRYLKRKHGVQLGWLYHLIALGAGHLFLRNLAGPRHDLWPFLYDVASATVVLGSVFLIAMVDRYVWELYFKQRHHVEVEIPRGSPPPGHPVTGRFLVLRYHYHQTINGLLIAPGILVVIVGFATQDSVGNIISGLTLQVGKRFTAIGCRWIARVCGGN